MLDDLGLPAAIEWQAGDFQKRSGIRCQATIRCNDDIIDKNLATAVFRIFQETITNSARHAKATSCRVSLTKNE
jgi:signal transduction histidine kinase